MTLSLLANHALSFAIVMLCWWHTHASAARHEPYGRLVAIGYAAVGTATMVVAVFRQLDAITPWLSVGYKLALLGLFLAKAARLRALYLERQK